MEKIYLRPLHSNDLTRICAWHNDPSLYEMLLGNYRPVSSLTVDEWLQKKLAYNNNEINLAICITAEGTHIGNIYLRDIDWIARRAEMHIFIGDTEHRSKGFGEAAWRLLMKYAIEDLGLRRLYLFVLADNEQAINIYRKCGFVEEGMLRQHAYKKGKWKDVFVMAYCVTD